MRRCGNVEFFCTSTAPAGCGRYRACSCKKIVSGRGLLAEPPSHTTVRAVRHTAVHRKREQRREPDDAAVFPVGTWHRAVEWPAGDAPVAFSTKCDSCSFPFRQLQRKEFAESRAWVFPVRPLAESQSPQNLLLKLGENARCFSEREVPYPSPAVGIERRNTLLHAPPVMACGNLSYFRLETHQRFRRYSQSDPVSAKETIAKELPVARFIDGALARVDFQAQAFFQETACPGRHPFPRAAATHVNVAVVRIAAESVASFGEKPIEVIEHDVGEKRGEWTALRRPLIACHYHPVDEHSGLQIAPNHVQDPLVFDSLPHAYHQLVVVHRIEESLQVDVHDPVISRFNEGF